ncbi:uncharacterized protein trdc [Myripristis murdjan]|uniref:uncharacterized protein trdc n=1 Tax=Myripristis murdjan TaxID=586833 RepID=UPI001175F101|nr:uncharacterized protein LOC115375377 [Myripristis murdjan]
MVCITVRVGYHSDSACTHSLTKTSLSPARLRSPWNLPEPQLDTTSDPGESLADSRLQGFGSRRPGMEFWSFLCRCVPPAKAHGGGQRSGFTLLNTDFPPGGFCMELYHSANPLTFGKRIRLTVLPRDPKDVKPTLSILRPQVGGGSNTTGPQVCLAASFYPRGGTMVLTGSAGREERSTSDAPLCTATKTYFYVGVSKNSFSSCELNGTTENYIEPVTTAATTPTTTTPPVTTRATPPAPADPYRGAVPVNRKLNSQLLLMNGLRLLFTKTLAINMMLTIRAVLC